MSFILIMYDISNNILKLDNPILWVDFIVSAVILIALFIVLLRLVNRKLAYVLYGVSALGILAAWFFSLKLVWLILLVVLACLLITLLTINISELRPFFANSLSGKNGLSKASEKIFDRHALYTKIETAVTTLSKNQIGAIITFERNVELDDVVKSGTILNCPITPELILTIFYPGTRLHDGAVVVRKDLILAASVYYTPTTKPLNGKFGSRHRAAIGISEMTDSVTVVVSEETGRISLAVAGELIPVNSDNFLRTFEDYMFEEDKKVELEKTAN